MLQEPQDWRQMWDILPGAEQKVYPHMNDPHDPSHPDSLKALWDELPERPAVGQRLRSFGRAAVDVGKGVYEGLGQAAGRLGMMEGPALLSTLENVPIAPAQAIGRMARRAMPAAKAAYEAEVAKQTPESGAQVGGQAVGNLVGEGAKYMAGGGAVRAGLSKLPRLAGLMAPKAAGAGVGGAVTAAGREAAKDALAFAPVDVLTTLPGPEYSTAGVAAETLSTENMAAYRESESKILRAIGESSWGAGAANKLREIADNPVQRGAFEAAVGIGMDGVLRVAGLALRGLRGLESGARGRMREGWQPDIRPVEPEPPKALPRGAYQMPPKPGDPDYAKYARDVAEASRRERQGMIESGRYLGDVPPLKQLGPGPRLGGPAVIDVEPVARGRGPVRDAEFANLIPSRTGGPRLAGPAGAATPEALGTLARAGVGGAVGGAVGAGEGHPVAGAVAGAGVGLGAPAALKRLRALGEVGSVPAARDLPTDEASRMARAGGAMEPKYQRAYDFGGKIRELAGGKTPGEPFYWRWANGELDGLTPDEFDYWFGGFSEYDRANDPVVQAYLDAGIKGTNPPTKTVGMRFGAAPESGRSANTRENIAEAGVSMAEVADPSRSDYFWADIGDGRTRPKHYYEGYMIHHARGGDDEPLMVGVREVDEGTYLAAKSPPSTSGTLGAATPAAVRTVAGAGIGAVTGAATDEKSPRRGALTGAIAGATLAGAGPPALRRLRAKPAAGTRFANDATVQKVAEGIGSDYTEKVVKPSKALGSRTRREITREILPLEKFGELHPDEPTLVRDALAQSRGWLETADERIENALGPVIRQANEAGLSDVRTLAYAEHALELMDAGLDKTPYTRQELQATIQRLGAVPEIRQATDALHDYYRDLLQWKLDNGVISQDQFNAWTTKHQRYIPFIEIEAAGGGVGTSGGKVTPSSTGVRRMTDRIAQGQKVDPFEQAALDTMETARTVGKQRVANVLAETIEKSPQATAGLVEQVKAWPETNAKGEVIGWKHEGKPSEVVRVNREGKPVFYRFTDEAKPLQEAWASMDNRTSNLLMDAANTMRTTFQATITGHPAFLVVNGIRDFIVSGLQYPMMKGLRKVGTGAALGGAAGAAANPDDRVGGAATGAALGASAVGGVHLAKHVGRTLSALNDILGPRIVGGLVGGTTGAVTANEDQSEFVRFLEGAALGYGVGAVAGKAGLKGNRGAYDAFRREGGGGFGYYAGTRAQAQRRLDKALKGGPDLDDVLNPKSWWDGLQYVSRAVETAPRLAKYKANRAAGMSEGASIFEARDLSLDFSVKGRSTKGISKVVPFMNPALQGVDKLVRLMGDKETWPIAAATVLAPTVALWSAIHADEETATAFQSRPLFERNTYWLVPKKWFGADNGFVKVPKPFEIGAIYASLPERVLDYRYHQDPEQLKVALQEMWGQFGPGNFFGLPVGIDAAFEVSTGEHGYDRFRRREIDPYPWENIAPELQYNDWTSTPAVMAGRALRTSPAKIDHLLKGVSGSIGSQVLDAVTRAARSMDLDPRGPNVSEARPMFARLHTTDSSISEQERAFRRKWDAAEEARNSVKRAAEAGDQEEIGRLVDRYRDDLRAYYAMKEQYDQLTRVAEIRNRLWEVEGVDDKKRREAIARLNENVAKWLSGKGTLSAEERR